MYQQANLNVDMYIIPKTVHIEYPGKLDHENKTSDILYRWYIIY